MPKTRPYIYAANHVRKSSYGLQKERVTTSFKVRKGIRKGGVSDNWSDSSHD